MSSTHKVIPSSKSSTVELSSISNSLLIEKTTKGYSLNIDASSITAGGAASITCDYTAGETISALSLVYYNHLDGMIYKADKDTLINASALGIAITAGTAGESIKVLQYGLLTDNAFHFTPAQLIFLNNNGQLTVTAPTLGYLTRIGRAINENTLLILIESPVTL